MNKESKKPFVFGGWKCNGTKQSVTELLDGYSKINTSGLDVVFAPSFIHLSLAQSYALQNMEIGAQNCSATSFGAYTGEIAARQLIDFGVEYVMIGHSERRSYYGETDQIIYDKIKKATSAGLTVIACLGESLKDRKENNVDKVCHNQLMYIMNAVSNIETNWNKIILLYEPVWAIGTGVACSASLAQNTHKSLRRWIRDNISETVAKHIRIAYGGSVNPNNIYDLIKQPDIDGVGVGKASLNSTSFENIITTVQTVYKMKSSKL
eukprot:37724_1